MWKAFPATNAISLLFGVSVFLELRKLVLLNGRTWKSFFEPNAYCLGFRVSVFSKPSAVFIKAEYVHIANRFLDSHNNLEIVNRSMLNFLEPNGAVC